jgi:transcription-repair coupling factor (superfamily II helicase)
MGARDLSVMETPPRNRTPVMTQIVEWDNDFIASAIENEVKRGGQIFFVSDKVHDLDKISTDLQKLIPNLRIATAHGQLPPHKLETIMEGFIEGNFDILLATKIIESGIDIPNANTIFINRSQNFGLAELYQLRGRVGRTNKQAFCYLLIPSTHKLNSMAVRRLQSIEEFTELGSGLQLAMRDLEIRGAGNLLGAEQSGFIIDIGFELFQKILDEAVTELKNEEFADVFGIKEEDIKPKFSNEDIQIELDTDALFPTDFIPNETDRFIFYKKLYKVNAYKELNDIVNEIQDRFGKLPKQARNLVYAVKVRIAAIETGFVKIIIKADKMICEFPQTDKKDYYEKAFPLVIDYITDLPNVKLNQTKKKLLLEADIESRDQVIEILWKIKKTIEYI